MLVFWLVLWPKEGFGSLSSLDSINERFDLAGFESDRFHITVSSGNAQGSILCMLEVQPVNYAKLCSIPDVLWVFAGWNSHIVYKMSGFNETSFVHSNLVKVTELTMAQKPKNFPR